MLLYWATWPRYVSIVVCHKIDLDHWIVIKKYSDTQQQLVYLTFALLTIPKVWISKYPLHKPVAWWRHQMETFFALLALCAGNLPVTGEFPSQRSMARSFDVFFHLRLNKGLSKQSWGRWFETPSCPFWRQCNETQYMTLYDYPSVHLSYNLLYFVRGRDRRLFPYMIVI